MTYDSTAIKERVTAYVNEAAHGAKGKISESSLIFKEGFLDSMGLIVMITFLEEEFKIKTNDSDLLEENFESIHAITNFVLRKSAN